MLLREMDHRIKNLFAMVGGAVTLSARSATTTKGMAETIHGRLGALAIAHQLIRPSRPDSGAVMAQSSLGELVRTILAPYMDPAGPGGANRVAVEGPEVRIGGEAVTSLALVLHELATNAAKYGAFSTAAGRLLVSWKLERDKLLFLWEESGGPMVAHAPEREGFGSLLARRSVSGQLEGQLTFDWKPEGLIVRIAAARERLTPAMA